MANNRELSQLANVVGYNGGNIGIGIDSPSQNLHVSAASGTRIQVSHTGGSVDALLGTDSGNAFTGTSTNHDFRIITNNGERVRITSGGRVGINSISPATALDIQSTKNSDGLTITKAGTRSAFLGHNGSGTEGLLILRENGTNKIQLYAESNQTSFINTGGDIGIGTDNPQQQVHLHNAGSSNVFTTRIQQKSSNTPTDGGALLELGGTRSDGTFGFYGGIKGGRRNSAADNKGYLAFFSDSNDGQSLSERMRLDENGRLLVGYTANVAPDGYESLIQTSGLDYRGGSLSIRRDGNNASGPALLLTKSRSGSIGGNTVVSNGDVLGTIWFYGADGNDVNQAGAKIQCHVDYTAGSNNMPGRLEFHTTSDGAASPTERMRIDSAGRVLIANAGSYYSSGEALSVSTSNNGSVQVMRNTNASFNNSLIFGYTSRASNSAFQYIKLAANAASDTDFVLRGDGNAYADGSWYTGGADYAEYFEWSDGNTSAEDRRGISVVLVDDKIREAVAGEDPIGVISGNPSVVGDVAWNKWNGKYLRDDFGTYIQEDYEVEDEDGNTVVQQRRQINPAWNSENEYVSREDRAEWDTVGLMGKLRIRKGQITGTRWIKMRDISDTVEEWLVR